MNEENIFRTPYSLAYWIWPQYYYVLPDPRKTAKDISGPKLLKDKKRGLLYDNHPNKELESIANRNDLTKRGPELKEAFRKTSPHNHQGAHKEQKKD